MYDATKDDWEWDETLSDDENVENLEKRTSYLYQWSKDNWEHSIHAPGAECRAQHLDSIQQMNVEDMRCTDEMEAWCVTEDLMESQMWDILEEWHYYGSPENAYMEGGYQWMLWATGFQIYDTYEIVVKWLEENDYDRRNDIMEMMCQSFGGEEF